MCGKCCEVEETEKPVKYECNCGTDCECPIIEFDKEPETVPYCCDVPMKRVK
ncbi:MAG: hypothetical protein AAB110_10280 [Candidatus Desantisbacteria bacterium]